jgi:hypothetical protein
MSVKDTSNVDKLLKAINSLNNRVVDVGILSSSSGEIIKRAEYNEFGTSKIPERSFIRAGFDKNKSKLESQGNKLMKSVVSMDITATQAAETLGEVAKGMIQDYAIKLKDPPNADSTIWFKGSENPLVDTGQMISSINYKGRG